MLELSGTDIVDGLIIRRPEIVLAQTAPVAPSIEQQASIFDELDFPPENPRGAN